MIYVFHLLDKPHGLDLRQRIRPEHKAYLAAVADRIAFAGPLLADDGTTMVGSVLAIDFDNRKTDAGRSRDEDFPGRQHLVARELALAGNSVVVMEQVFGNIESDSTGTNNSDPAPDLGPVAQDIDVR